MNGKLNKLEKEDLIKKILEKGNSAIDIATAYKIIESDSVFINATFENAESSYTRFGKSIFITCNFNGTDISYSNFTDYIEPPIK